MGRWSWQRLRASRRGALALPALLLGVGMLLPGPGVGAATTGAVPGMGAAAAQPTPAPASAVLAPFTQRYRRAIYGDFVSTGALVLRGASGSDGDPATFDSSTAPVTIPAGAAVDYAQLDWGGDTGVARRSDGTPAPFPACDATASASGTPAVPPPGTPAAQKLRVTVGSGPSTAVAPAPGRFSAESAPAAGQAQRYSAEADVTALFARAPSGKPLPVTVANLWTPAGIGCSGSWSLLVVYRYPGADPLRAPFRREVVVSSGALQQRPGAVASTITVSGFEVAAVAPVHLALAVGAAADGQGQGQAAVTARLAVNGTPVPGWRAAAGTGPVTVPPPALPAGATSAALSFAATAGSYLVQSVALSAPTPGVQIVARAASGSGAPGGPASVTVTVVNSGAVPLAGVAVAAPGLPACGRVIGTLAVAQITAFRCTATPASDLKATVSVSGAPPAGPMVRDSSSVSVRVPVAARSAHPAPRPPGPGPGRASRPARPPAPAKPDVVPAMPMHPGLAVAAKAEQRAVRSGGQVRLMIQVRNSGDVALTEVAVHDAAAPDCGKAIGTLAAGATVSFSCALQAPLGFADPAMEGDLTSVAEAAGRPPAGTVVRGSSQPVMVDVQHPALRLVQAADHDRVRAGAPVRLTITVLNSGDVPLAPVTVAAPPLAACGQVYTRLDPGGAGSFNCTVPHLTRSLRSEAGATGVPPLGPPVLASTTHMIRVQRPVALKGVLLNNVRADLALMSATLLVALGILVVLFAPRPRRRRRYRSYDYHSD